MTTNTVTFDRTWAMPCSDTFDCVPIAGFVQKYLMRSTVSVDPFARNKRWATYTNDLDPGTAAESHCDAAEFLHILLEKGVVVDLAIVDPPYSPRQVKEMYDSVGLKCGQEDTQIMVLRKRVRDGINLITKPGAIALTFGWNTVGMGKGWIITEIILVCHGSAHNDTICMAEKKLEDHPELNYEHTPPSLSDPTSTPQTYE